MNSTAPVLSQKYPPVGQESTGMLPGHYRIGRGGPRDMVFDRNIGVMRAFRGGNGFVRISHEDVDSELSGERGFYLQTDWVTLALTPEEAGRFFLRRLTSEEYFKLVQKHGVFFEICDQFYDEETGEALRPMAAGDLERERAEQLAGRLPAAERRVAAVQADAEERGNILRLATRHRPHVLVLKDDVGSRAHSIVSLSQAEALIPAFASSRAPEPKVVLLEAPPGEQVPLRTFDNLITLISYDDGTLQAFGPFAGPGQLVDFRPPKAEKTAIRIQRTDLVNSSAIAAQMPQPAVRTLNVITPADPQ